MVNLLPAGVEETQDDQDAVWPFPPMRYTSNEEKSDSKLASLKWTLPVLLLGKSNSTPVRGESGNTYPAAGDLPQGATGDLNSFLERCALAYLRACVCET